jgi:hypothetical protein
MAIVACKIDISRKLKQRLSGKVIRDVRFRWAGPLGDPELYSQFGIDCVPATPYHPLPL